jgi:predicted kinase
VNAVGAAVGRSGRAPVKLGSMSEPEAGPAEESARPAGESAAVWVVAGAPGAGKSTVADLLVARLNPHPALLDKDTLFAGLAAEIALAHGRPSGEREGDWYDRHVKRHEYGAMTQAARQIRAGGCPVLLVAPFTTQIHEPQLWANWVQQLGGEPVRLLWVRSDADTLRRRLRLRASDRDGGKLAGFEAFVERMRPDLPPPVPHQTVDNRRDAPDLADQLALVLRQEC